MKLNFVVLCVKDNNDGSMNIKHICCYESFPTEDSINDLHRELAEDESFGMIGDTDYETLILDRNKPGVEEALINMDLNLPTEIDEV